MGFITRTAARAMLSGIFIYSGYGMVNNAERYAKQASKVLPMLPDEPMLARAHGITMLAAGSTFALGIFPKLSARILALTLITNTYVGHQFWKAEKPEDRRPQLIHFLKNVGLFGGLLYVSSDKRSKQRNDGSD
jgi:putative oxidoreductase